MTSVSVVIPTFDRASWLPETVGSVLAQTVQPQEIVIVDDGSTDVTQAVCRRLEGPVRCLRQDNRGVAAARNRGAEAARGEWLAFLDSDDLWAPDKLEVQLAALTATDADWSITGCEVTDGDRRPLHGLQGFDRAFPMFRDLKTDADEFFRRHFEVSQIVVGDRAHRLYHGDAHLPFFFGNFASPTTAVVRRDLFVSSGGFDEGFTVAEDTEFFHRLADEGRLVVVASPLVSWFTGHSVSLVSADIEQSIRNALESLDRAVARRVPRTAEVAEAYAIGRTLLLDRLAYRQLTELDPPGARRTLREIRGLRPGLSARRLLLHAASFLPRGVLRAIHGLKRGLRRR